MSLSPRLLVGVAAGVVLLSACGGNESVAAPVTALPSATTASSAAPVTTSVSPTPSVDPFSREGAEAFVRAYYADLNTALQRTDSSVGRNKTAEDCPCRSFFALIDREKARGLTFRTEGYSITTLFYRSNDQVVVNYSAAAADAIDSSGAVVDHEDAKPAKTDLVSLTRKDNSWLVSNVQPAS